MPKKMGLLQFLRETDFDQSSDEWALKIINHPPLSDYEVTPTGQLVRFDPDAPQTQEVKEMLTEKPMSQARTEMARVDAPTADTLEHLFTYHGATEETIPKYKKIRAAGLNMARVIDECCPAGADKSAAIRKVREAVMTANAAIACYTPAPVADEPPDCTPDMAPDSAVDEV